MQKPYKQQGREPNQRGAVPGEDDTEHACCKAHAMPGNPSRSLGTLKPVRRSRRTVGSTSVCTPFCHPTDVADKNPGVMTFTLAPRSRLRRAQRGRRKRTPSAKIQKRVSVIG